MYIELVGPIQTPCALWFSGPKPMYLLLIKTNSTCIYIYICLYILLYLKYIYIYMINIIIILIIIITHIYIYTELVGPNRTPCTLWFGGPKPVYLLVIKTNSTYIFINIYIYIELVGPIQTPCTLWFGGPKPGQLYTTFLCNMLELQSIFFGKHKICLERLKLLPKLVTRFPCFHQMERIQVIRSYSCVTWWVQAMHKNSLVFICPSHKKIHL